MAFSLATIWVLTPPCLDFLGRMLTVMGRSISLLTSMATPAGSLLISSSNSPVMPSRPLLRALRSFGLVTRMMIWVLHWEMTFLSTRAGLWLMIIRPRPNLRPSAAMVRTMLVLAAFPVPRSGM